MFEKTVRNQLTYSQAFKLQKWAEAEKSKLAAFTHQQIAQVATGHLGFAVTDSNIKGAEKVLELQLGKPEGRRLFAESGSAGDIAFIAACVVQLYSQINIDPPPRLLEISQK